MAQSLMGSPLLCTGSWCTQDFVCALQEWSFCLPQSCGSIAVKPTGLQSRFSGDSFSHCQTPRLGSLMWGPELSLQWEIFCGTVVFQFLGHAMGMGFDFIAIAPLLPSRCGFLIVFGCRVSFLVGSSIFLSMVIQQLVVIPVFL